MLSSVEEKLKAYTPPRVMPPLSPHPYDSVPWLTHEYLISKIIDDVGDNKRVLIIGCRTAPWIEKLVKRSAVVIGIDTDEEMVDYASRRWNAHDNVLFEVGDLRFNHLNSGIFDVVISLFSFGEIGGTKKAFQEVPRILDNKGKFIVAEDIPFKSHRRFHMDWMDKAGKKASLSPAFMAYLFRRAGFSMVRETVVQLHKLSSTAWSKALLHKVGDARTLQVLSDLKGCLNTSIGKAYCVKHVNPMEFDADLLFDLKVSVMVGVKVGIAKEEQCQ